MKGYVDAYWAKCLATRRFVSGYLVYFGNSLISWKSKKRDHVSHSSAEFQYRALGVVSSAEQKAVMILKLKFSTHVPVNCDNYSAIKLALNPLFHEKTKHFEVDVHFVRDKVSK